MGGIGLGNPQIGDFERLVLRIRISRLINPHTQVSI